jgi:hypothetical protein
VALRGPPHLHRSGGPFLFGLLYTTNMLSPSQYKCSYQKGFYICSGQLQAFVNLQKAIDRLINLLPIFRPIDPAPGQSPIGTSKAGYDGRIGPTTSGLGLIALIGAFEVRREAGDNALPPDAVAISLRDTQEVPRTTNFAKFALELTSYLNDTSNKFSTLIEAIRVKQKPTEETSVFIDPPPLPLPPSLSLEMSSRLGDPTRKLVQAGAGGVLAILAIFFMAVAYKSRSSALNKEEVLPAKRPVKKDNVQDFVESWSRK